MTDRNDDPRLENLSRENYEIVVQRLCTTAVEVSANDRRAFAGFEPGVAGMPLKMSCTTPQEPTPIQRQAIPIGLQRRDLIGIARERVVEDSCL
jgi:hypothetical protein